VHFRYLYLLTKSQNIQKQTCKKTKRCNATTVQFPKQTVQHTHHVIHKRQIKTAEELKMPVVTNLRFWPTLNWAQQSSIAHSILHSVIFPANYLADTTQNWTTQLWHSSQMTTTKGIKAKLTLTPGGKTNTTDTKHTIQYNANYMICRALRPQTNC